MAAKPYVWQMIKEAMDNIGDKASYSDIKKYIHSKYGEVNNSTITCQIIVCTVNHATRSKLAQGFARIPGVCK
ncbi:DUF7669 domain-containing protein [Clostridium botulinum]|uniref:DUF7669 domain-containing protein n=1 Tax=Clostridium botulinum (strain Kyoto / Type A2) TaxID=536232 RepID=C1FPX5_CLOBJ|nr:histone H1/H5 family protein [Clostridium botulinum]ACO84003.1 hypothetical protein CLM_2292 [Clostridium botulinum A2 str. Kyoto]AUN07219.1 hypothetical protein RSJ14_11115 [Clostridium botulinum]MBN3364516.1 hypothetical protein [Clostridium botulinum]MBN3376088.1 hypothetical protein [Clostridium botulinum]MBN3385272.1 hypothetical protein [Clostridium botulinum]